jgi:hypothetical protein
LNKSTTRALQSRIPIEWAEANTSGTTVTVIFRLTTYHDSTQIGDTLIYTKSVLIPESVKPTCSLSIIDATNIYNNFSKYIEKASKFAITVDPTLAYGSEIVSYEINANGQTYTQENATVTTDFIARKGTNTITATVTDGRGRSGTTTMDIDVAEYPAPKINSLKVLRCKSLTDGTEDMTGGFAQVKFTASVDNLLNGNTPKYTIEYKKSNESEYTTVPLNSLTGNYSITDETYRFAAADNSPYIVRLIVDDGTAQAEKVTRISTAEVLEHWHYSGRGIAFGKIAEQEGLFDIGYLARFLNGLMPIEIVATTNLDTIIAPNNYIGGDIAENAYVHCPISSGPFGLEVIAAGSYEDGGETKYMVKQIFHPHSKASPISYARIYDGSDWGEWNVFGVLTDDQGTLYATQDYVAEQINAAINVALAGEY